MGSVVEAAVEAFRAAQRGSREARARLEELRGPLVALADEGDVEAQNALGGIALEHDGDAETALRYWTLAAQRRHPAAQRGLGHLYAAGKGVERDVEKAAELFRPAALAGDQFAMYNLALLHLREERLAGSMSRDELVSLLEGAADKGLAEAATELGNLLAKEDRDEEALRWYLRAAHAGYPEAMYVAGCWYRDGYGTEPDPVQAVRWFLAMLGAGSGDGVHEAIKLAGSMTDEQIRRAAVLAGDPNCGDALVSTVRGRTTAD
ncbi:tetratricopeptide repeat protein [Actinomadura keratinilytica]|jgi:TPR repeat protein|uniref:Sel1 repeat family protein n=1 Tax=Actinomadura keratinilytica TaxID=547461 RepID=A0ABP7Y1Y6_9ACTN